MVKRLIVVLSAMAMMIAVAGVASAQFPTGLSGMPGVLTTGDMIMIPMKVKYTFNRTTGGEAGGMSTFFMGGCEQYTAGFRPWGTMRATRCAMKVQVVPPKCVAPAYGGPVQWGAPPALPPNSKLVSNEEKFQVVSPGCNPCVTGGLSYEVVKKQVVK